MNVRQHVDVCVLACGRNQGYTECYCQHCADRLHSSQWTLGRARLLTESLPPPLCATAITLLHIVVSFVCFDKSINLQNRTLKVWDPLKTNTVASWEINVPAAVRRWCWQMFKPVTSLWTFACKKINYYTRLMRQMRPKVTAKSSSSNFYYIYNHSVFSFLHFLLGIKWVSSN